jgi:hypothetical protein
VSDTTNESGQNDSNLAITGHPSAAVSGSSQLEVCSWDYHYDWDADMDGNANWSSRDRNQFCPLNRSRSKGLLTDPSLDFSKSGTSSAPIIFNPRTLANSIPERNTIYKYENALSISLYRQLMAILAH